MKITKARLNQIIKEELNGVLREGFMDDIKGVGSAIMSKVTGKKEDQELALKLNDMRGAMEEVMSDPAPPNMGSPATQRLAASVPPGSEGGGKGWSLNYWVDDPDSVPQNQRDNFHATTKAARLMLRAIADGSAAEGGEGFGPAYAMWQANPSDGSWGLPD